MIDKYLILKVNELFPPEMPALKSCSVDGLGYEPQLDGSIKVTDYDGNHIATVWRDDEGQVIAYEDIENGQCVPVTEEDAYFEEDYSCDPQYASCPFYHDDTQQTTNSAQRFAETPAQNDTPAQTQTHTQTSGRCETVCRSEKSEETHSIEPHTVTPTDGAPVVAHGFVEGTSAQPSQPAVQMQVADGGTASQVAHQIPMTHTVQNDDHGATSPVTKVAVPASETETVQAESGAVFVESAMLCASDTEAAATAAIVREGILAERISDEMAAASGQVFVTAVASDTTHQVDVQPPVIEATNVEHQRTNTQTNVTAAVTVDNDPNTDSERASRTAVSVVDAETGWDPQELFFVGSPMFFMPSHEGAGVAMAMQQMTEMQERVANVGSRGDLPDHEDSQGNRDRDDDQNEEDEETPALETVA